MTETSPTLKAGPVRHDPEKLAELQAGVDKTNALLKSVASPLTAPAKIVQANYKPTGEQLLTTRSVREDECPQCHGYMIGFAGFKQCAVCGLPKGIPLERDLRAAKSTKPAIDVEMEDFYEQSPVLTPQSGPAPAPVSDTHPEPVAGATTQNSASTIGDMLERQKEREEAPAKPPMPQPKGKR
jgi:hypothetical protein